MEYGEKGQGLVEYTLILVLVSVVAIVVLALLGPTIGNVFSNVVSAIGGTLPGGGGSPPVYTPQEYFTARTAFCSGQPAGTPFHQFHVTGGTPYVGDPIWVLIADSGGSPVEVPAGYTYFGVSNCPS